MPNATTKRALKSIAGLAAAAALASGCASQMELEAIGAQQFEQIRETSALVKDRATIDYVACVANAIVDTLEGPDADMYWELAVVDNPTINAFVLPGGKIVVFTGILDVAENQHQLAAVMGHEVAHVTADHPKERMARQEVTNFGADTIGLILGGGYARQTSAAMNSMRTIAQLGVLNPFSRGQETEADLIGLEYMAKAGFDPRESVELWKRMGEKNKTSIPEYMSTHPSGETRINELIGHYPTALVYYNEAKEEGKAPNCQP